MCFTADFISRISILAVLCFISSCQQGTWKTTRPSGRTGELVGDGVESWTDGVYSGNRSAEFVFEYLEATGCRDESIDKISQLTDQRDCEDLCSARPDCGAFTHDAEGGKCYLKKECINTKRKLTNQSGIKKGVVIVEPDKDEPSPSSIPTAVPSPVLMVPEQTMPTAQPGDHETNPSMSFGRYLGIKCEDRSIYSGQAFFADECQERCLSHNECKGWSFNVRRSMCYTKRECNSMEADDNYITGISPDIDQHAESRAGAMLCPSRNQGSCEDGSGEECPAWSSGQEESTDPVVNRRDSPYQDIIDGNKTFVTTYPENEDWPTCPFVPPSGPRRLDWADECIANARQVGFLQERKGRPNKECPAGWFLCKGMCYTLVQRNNRGPSVGPSYYAPDYMSVEARCGLCGGARVAFVGEADLKMQRVAAEAAAQTINEDKAVWVRRFRFLNKPNKLVEAADNPYQPWHRFVVMKDHDKQSATYQRYYTGEKDGLDSPQWDKRYRNQEASILCVNTIPRIHAALRSSKQSRLTMEEGCSGQDKDNMWDNHDHRWFPTHNYPFPGM